MQENSAIRYSLVIPVFRSGDCLQELARRLVDVLEPLGKNYEVIFVDDASPDKSWDVLNSIVSERPHFKAIQLMRNFGQTQATLCGIKNAIGEVVITLDDDLQHDPSVLPNLLEEFEGFEQQDPYDGDSYGHRTEGRQEQDRLDEPLASLHGLEAAERVQFHQPALGLLAATAMILVVGEDLLLKRFILAELGGEDRFTGIPIHYHDVGLRHRGLQIARGDVNQRPQVVAARC